MNEDALVYFKTINWSARMSRELPVLKEIISMLAPRESISVLDLGCGPGLHLIELKKFFPNIEFVGADNDAGMLEIGAHEAEKQGVDVSFLVKDLVNEPDYSLKGKFDFVYSLGNTLNLIINQKKIEDVMSAIGDLIKDDGVFFFQILNNSKPRDGYVISKVIRNDEETKEYFTVKRFEPRLENNEMQVEFLSFTRELKDDKLEFKITKASWLLYSFPQIVSALKIAGFSRFQAWANYSKDKFIEDCSGNLLLLATRMPSLVNK
ncbi:MAG: class I SAM-dependent methyltransferase [Promethearchaeota archaeon]